MHAKIQLKKKKTEIIQREFEADASFWPIARCPQDSSWPIEPANLFKAEDMVRKLEVWGLGGKKS